MLLLEDNFLQRLDDTHVFYVNTTCAGPNSRSHAFLNSHFQVKSNLAITLTLPCNLAIENVFSESYMC